MSETTAQVDAATDSAPGRKRDGSRVGMGERFAYASGDIGSNLIFAPLSAFMLFFLTDVVGIGAAVVGTILLLGQFMNGITDLIFGFLIDKTRTRWGKTRPWILWTAIPMGVAFVAIFAVPSGLGDTGKIIWAFVSYTLVMAVFFTASNLAYSALVSVITADSKTRVTLTSMRFFFSVLTTLAVTAVTLPAVEALGGGQGGWVSLMSIYAAIAVTTLLVVFFGTRERVATAEPTKSSRDQSLKMLLKHVARNPYFFLAAAMFIIFYLVNGLGSAVGIYYTSIIMGDAGLYSVVSATGILPLLIGIPFVPWLMGRFGKRHVFLGGIALAMVGTGMLAFDPANLTLVLTSGIVRGFGLVPLTAGFFALVADVVDYGEWRTGVRTDGLIFSSVVFGQKVGGGLAAAGAGWLLSGAGYVAGAATQPDAVSGAILAAYIWIPLVLSLVLAVIIWFFRIERHRPEIEKYLAQNSVPADEMVLSDVDDAAAR